MSLETCSPLNVDNRRPVLWNSISLIFEDPYFVFLYFVFIFLSSSEILLGSVYCIWDFWFSFFSLLPLWSVLYLYIYMFCIFIFIFHLLRFVFCTTPGRLSQILVLGNCFVFYILLFYCSQILSEYYIQEIGSTKKFGPKYCNCGIWQGPGIHYYKGAHITRQFGRKKSVSLKFSSSVAKKYVFLWWRWCIWWNSFSFGQLMTMMMMPRKMKVDVMKFWNSGVVWNVASCDPALPQPSYLSLKWGQNSTRNQWCGIETN